MLFVILSYVQMYVSVERITIILILASEGVKTVQLLYIFFKQYVLPAYYYYDHNGNAAGVDYALQTL